MFPFSFTLEMVNKLSNKSLLQHNTRVKKVIRVFIHTLKEYCKKKTKKIFISNPGLAMSVLWSRSFPFCQFSPAEIAFLHLLANYLQLFRYLPILKLFIGCLPILCYFHQYVCIVRLLVCLFLSQ